LTVPEILPSSQKALLRDLKPMASLGFTLYGGTARALRLGHRESIDFDFFSAQPLNRAKLLEKEPFLTDAIVLQDEIDTWTVQVYPLGNSQRPVKICFFGSLKFGRVAEPSYTDQNELFLASLDYLFGHKLQVLLQRVELKDYQDIATLLRAGLLLERGIEAASSLFPKMFPGASAGAREPCRRNQPITDTASAKAVALVASSSRLVSSRSQAPPASCHWPTMMEAPALMAAATTWRSSGSGRFTVGTRCSYPLTVAPGSAVVHQPAGRLQPLDGDGPGVVG
jgi:hypothetical protein